MMTELLLTLEEAEKRINEIAEVLECRTSGSRRDNAIELRRLCGKHRIVPKSYKLEDVEREGRHPRRLSQVTEIWKGVWDDNLVALKILRVPRDDPDPQKTKTRFCKEVAMMKQLDNKNILPFHGVSATVSEFCLVFPWYENGNIMDYLKKNQNSINQFQLLLDAVDGLCFLHNNGLAHGSFRPTRILVDDDGTARLTIGGRTSVIAQAGHGNFRLGDNASNPRYRAPEFHWPEEYGMEKIDKVTSTRESDVYEVAMATYAVLTEKNPYFKWNDTAALEKIRVGEPPQKPSGVDDDVWEFLRKCWNSDPKERPSIAEVRGAFSQFCSLPKFTFDPDDLLATELPGKVNLQIQSIRVGFEKSRQKQFCVKLKYGNKDHTTPVAKFVEATGEHGWGIPESWLFETNKQHHGQLISLELLQWTNMFQKDRVCATGSFSLTDSINKQTKVKLEAPDGAGSAVLKAEIAGEPVGGLEVPRVDHSRAPLMTERVSTLEDAEKRVDEITEVLARGISESVEVDVIELRRLCGKHRIVPKSYKLEGVEREGRHPQHLSQVTEIWKGAWDGKVVALKVLRVPQDNPGLQGTKSWFCKDVALMKQLDNKNILPFYGVSTTVSEFCLVFPWYENGNIMDYLKENPDINQFQLATIGCDQYEKAPFSPTRFDVVNRVTYSWMTAVQLDWLPGVAPYYFTVLLEDFRPGCNISNSRYRAPELHWPEEYGTEKNIKVTATKESDVYEVAMATYEVLTGKMPYFRWNDTAALEKIRVGEPPQKPSGVDDDVWEFLRKCWNRDPKERPSIAEVRGAFSQFCSLPKFTFDPDDLLATELPGKVNLQIQSIRVGFEKSRQQQFCVKLKYGNKEHMTPAAKFTDALGEHGWATPESWLFETNKQHKGQLISLELLLRTNIFKRDRVCATGSFSVTGNVNKQTNVKLEVPGGAGSAVLKVLLTEM